MQVRSFSIRIPVTDERVRILDRTKTEKEVLTVVKDHLFKPKGQKLVEFNPKEICVCLREDLMESGRSDLTEIKTPKAQIGYYSDKRLIAEGIVTDLFRKAEELGYEKWGELTTSSEEYIFPNRVTVLWQMINPVGNFVKVESFTLSGFEEIMRLLSAGEEEKIEENAAVLLAEQMGLI